MREARELEIDVRIREVRPPNSFIINEACPCEADRRKPSQGQDDEIGRKSYWMKVTGLADSDLMTSAVETGKSGHESTPALDCDHPLHFFRAPVTNQGRHSRGSSQAEQCRIPPTAPQSPIRVCPGRGLPRLKRAAYRFVC